MPPRQRVRNTTLIERFERRWRARPSTLALRVRARAVSYAELEVRANRLAWQLIGEGIGPEDRVAICARALGRDGGGAPGRAEGGAAYVPLDPDDPPERLAFLLEDARRAAC